MSACAERKRNKRSRPGPARRQNETIASVENTQPSPPTTNGTLLQPTGDRAGTGLVAAGQVRCLFSVPDAERHRPGEKQYRHG